MSERWRAILSPLVASVPLGAMSVCAWSSAVGGPRAISAVVVALAVTIVFESGY